MKTQLMSRSSGRSARRACLGVMLMAAVSLGAVKLSAASGAFPPIILFDPADGRFPEGVAVDKTGNVFVSWGAGASTSAGIWKFTPSGEQSVLFDFGAGRAYGLAVDAVGNVYVARPGGVVRVSPDGQADRLPGTENIVFANALAFDDQGNLFVTETFSFDPPLIDYACGPFGRGGIWRIPRGGTAELWLRDDLLTGLCLRPDLLSFPAGANGIAYHHRTVYVVNTERGIIVRIPVLLDGGSGTPEVAVVVPEPIPLFGIGPGDGLALDVHGNFYVPLPLHNFVVRISPDGQWWDAVGTPEQGLAGPASVAFGTGKGERRNLFIANISGARVVKVDAGFPGLPLP